MISFAKGYTGISVFPSVDAIEEFKVQAQNYSAEFGRSVGSVLNVLFKSGSNRFGSSFSVSPEVASTLATIQEKGAPPKERPFLRNVPCSEVVLEAELDIARPDLRSGNLAEAGGAEAAARVCEDRSIGGVLGFDAELEALAFLGPEAL